MKRLQAPFKVPMLQFNRLTLIAEVDSITWELYEDGQHLRLALSFFLPLLCLATEVLLLHYSQESTSRPRWSISSGFSPVPVKASQICSWLINASLKWTCVRAFNMLNAISLWHWQIQWNSLSKNTGLPLFIGQINEFSAFPSVLQCLFSKYWQQMGVQNSMHADRHGDTGHAWSPRFQTRPPSVPTYYKPVPVFQEETACNKGLPYLV